MAKFQVKVSNCSYGSKGDVIELEGVDKLNARQAVMLKPYKEPTVKKVPKDADKTLEVATPGNQKSGGQR